MPCKAVKDAFDKADLLWEPPPDDPPSTWMTTELVIPTEESAVPGQYTFTRHQFLREILDSFTNDTIEVVAVQKPAQVGWTLAFTAVATYFVRCDPSRVLVAMPTESEAEIWSKDRLQPLISASPALEGLIKPAKARDGTNSVLHKRFPGGALKMVGANSPTGLASWPAKRIMLDEVDRYPASAGDEGDPIALVKKRAQTYLKRGGKLVMGSTPDIAGLSLIEHWVGQGDQRRWFVPCHQCGHGQILEFETGVTWDKPEGIHQPTTAAYHCADCGVVWSDIERIANVQKGRWVPTAPATNVRSYIIDGLMSPDVTHVEMAREWLAARTDEKRKVFVNTYLGKTWSEESDAPDWKDLARRREMWPKGVLPDGVLMLTAATDVQKDRLETRIWGWGRGGTGWLVDTLITPAGPNESAAWEQIDKLLAEETVWESASGAPMRLERLAVDTGAFTEEVYGWGRAHRFDERVILAKGDARQPLVVGPRTVQEYAPTGKKAMFGVAITLIGTNKAKDYLLRKLRLSMPVSDEDFPAGYIHLPMWATDDELQQLTSERKIKQVNRRGYTEQVWKKKPGDRNEALDCLVYAYAGACAAGLWSAPEGFWTRREEQFRARPADAPPTLPAPKRAARLSALLGPSARSSGDPYLG
jgi:phage terminase large subunit GpA-like protein